MKKLLLPALLAVGLTSSAAAQEGENPFRKAKVGDWAEYKVTTSFAGMNIEGKLKMTVTAKTDKEVTLETAGAVGGMDIPKQEAKVDLLKAYDPLTSAVPKGAELKVEKLGDGKEKVNVGGKDYETTWMKMKAVGKVNMAEFSAEAKAWTAKEVPLGGTVKMEMTSKTGGMDISMKMELLGFGGK